MPFGHPLASHSAVAVLVQHLYNGNNIQHLAPDQVGVRSENRSRTIYAETHQKSEYFRMKSDGNPTDLWN